MLLRLGLSFALCLAMVLARADTPQTLFSDGFELLKTGKTKEAAAKFEVGLKADPTNALAHYYLGEAYLALKRDADAKKEFQKSLDLDSASSIADKAKERLTELSPSRVPPSSQATASNGKNGPSAQETLAFISEMESCPAILQKTETGNRIVGNDCQRAGDNLAVVVDSLDGEIVVTRTLTSDRRAGPCAQPARASDPCRVQRKIQNSQTSTAGADGCHVGGLNLPVSTRNLGRRGVKHGRRGIDFDCCSRSSWLQGKVHSDSGIQVHGRLSSRNLKAFSPR